MNSFSCLIMNGDGFLLQCEQPLWIVPRLHATFTCTFTHSLSHTHACFLHATRINWIPLSITYLSVSPSLYSPHQPFSLSRDETLPYSVWEIQKYISLHWHTLSLNIKTMCGWHSEQRLPAIPYGLCFIMHIQWEPKVCYHIENLRVFPI